MIGSSRGITLGTSIYLTGFFRAKELIAHPKKVSPRVFVHFVTDLSSSYHEFCHPSHLYYSQDVQVCEA